MRSLHFSEFEFNLDSMTLLRKGQAVAIGNRTCDLLLYLIQNQDRFVPRQELHLNIWKSERISPSTIPTCVLELRRILGGEKSNLIASRRLHGYRFTGVAELKATQNANTHTGTELPFVGRKQLLNTLHRATQTATTHLRGKTITIVGEAGSGKTRLVHEFALQATGRSDTIIARAIHSDSERPYSVWTSALRSALLRDPNNKTLTTYADRILRTLNEKTKAEADDHTEHQLDKRTFLTDWSSAFRSLATLRPLILVLEDMHYADSDSLSLLDRLSSEVDSAPIVLIVTMRPPLRDRLQASALARIAGGSNSSVLPIPPLTNEDIEDLINPFLPERAALARQIFLKSAGNAFYATYLCQMIQSSTTRDRFSLSEIKLNASEIVARQLNDLPQSCRTVLEHGSACGENFSPTVLARALNLPTLTVMSLLAPAEESRTVTFDGAEYSFRHSILRDSLYSLISNSDRLNIHQRIGFALESTDPCGTTPVAVFDHLYRSFPLTSFGRICDAAFAAADEAILRFAHNEAARILGNLLRLAERDTNLTAALHCDILISLSKALLYSENHSSSRKALLNAAAIAKREGLADRLARVGLDLAPDFLSIEVGTYDPDLVMILRQSLELLPSDSHSLRSQVLARLSQALRWKCNNRSQIEDYANAAVRLAHLSNDAKAKLASLAALADAASGPDLNDERIERTLRLQDAALSQGDRLCFLVQQTRLIAALLERGDIRSVAIENERYRVVAEETGLPQYRWYPVSTDSMLACISGRIDLAEEYAQEYARICGPEPDENFKQTYACQLILRQIESDRSLEILDLAESFAATHRSVLSWSAAVAWIQWDCGRLDAARENLRQFSDSDILTLYREPGGTIGLAALAETSSYIGSKRQAAFLYQLIAPIRARFATAGYGVAYFGSLERYASLLAAAIGLTEQAVKHAKSAVHQERRLGAPGWKLLAEMDLNRLLEKRDRTNKRGRAKISIPGDIQLKRVRRVYRDQYLNGA